MKTAVSVPDEVYLKAERLAKNAGRSRSEVYSTALREYVARHELDDVTDAVNRTVDDLGKDAGLDGFGRQAAGIVLGSSEW